MKRFFAIFCLSWVVFLVVATPALGATDPNEANRSQFVICGRGQNAPLDQQVPCTPCHIIQIGSNLVNFFSFTVVPIMATIFILVIGIQMIVSRGDPGTFRKAKDRFWKIISGLFIFYAAFLLTNTVLQLIVGDKNYATNWYKIECTNPVYGAGGPISGTVGGGGTNTGGGSGGGGGVISGYGLNGDCSGASCNEPSANVCGQTANNKCSTTNQWNAQIEAAASGRLICQGIDTVKMVKAIMANESSGSITANSGSSYGLMQLQPSTANLFKSACGVSDNIDPAWLMNSQNAQASICIAIEYMKSLVSSCSCDVRQIAAGYNAGGPDACAESTDCGSAAASAGGQCTACAGEVFTRRWECLWDDTQHKVCNADRQGSSLAETRAYVPQVLYCYNQS